MSSDGKLGAKLGPRLAHLTVAARAHAAEKLTPHYVRAFMHGQDQFFRLTGREAQATLGPLYRQLAQADDAPDWARDTFAFLADGLGQWQTILGSQVGGMILGQGVGALVTNELEPVVASILAANPSLILPATTAADSAARGLVDYGDAEKEAAYNGINAHRFSQLVRLAQTGPGVADALNLFRRGQFDAAKLARALTQAGVADEWLDDVVSLLREPLSPAVLADAVVRGILTEEHAAKQAEQSGVYGADFDVLVRDTGEAPALETLLEAYRRGIIDQPRLEHGIRTGRLRNEWIDVAEALRFAPMSPADAIRAAVQGHLPVETAKAKAAEAGLNPADFEPLYETAGEPISVTEALQLWRRGVIDQAAVEQAIREGRTKNKYIPAVLELRRHLLPERSVVAAHRAGAFTHAQAAARLVDLGLDPEDIAALLAESSAGRMAHHRALALTQLVDLFELDALTRIDVTAAIVSLGYDEHEAEEILQLADLRAARKLQDAVVAVIRAKYVTHRIDTATAGVQLDAAAVAPAHKQKLLDLWALERDVNVRLPTVAELTSAVKKGGLDPAVWADRLVQLGYHTDDIPIMAVAHGIGLGG